MQWTPPQNEPIFYELRMNIHCSRDDWLSTFSPENCVLYSSKCDAYVYSTDYYCAKFYAASIGNRNYTSDYSLPSNSVSIHRSKLLICSMRFSNHLQNYLKQYFYNVTKPLSYWMISTHSKSLSSSRNLIKLFHN